ncbi:MAG: sporulation initiation factor Spo0A C-terminal domain-containing protein [Lachnospiraceae bacterium]|nr:sporulation initiation factor Spo0A C-terminal domain-containing protein [Lachnospiraceae bacterium]
MEISNISDSLLERYITKVMFCLTIPAHLKGYYYLRSAILLCIRDEESAANTSKLLYPTIAKQFRTTELNVKRDIRSAIETCLDQCNDDHFEEIFGHSCKSGRYKLTNREFIARIADKIRLDIKTL